MAEGDLTLRRPDPPAFAVHFPVWPLTSSPAEMQEPDSSRKSKWLRLMNQLLATGRLWEGFSGGTWGQQGPGTSE